MTTAILQNIYSYLEVLHTASTEAVSEWDHEALEHALKWAEYCEKIHKQSQGKPYQNDLDAAIKKFEKLPITIGLEQVDLQLLKYAKQHMRKVLLQNQHVPPAVYESLLHSYGDLARNPHQLVQDCCCLVQSKALAEVSGFLLQSSPAQATSPAEIATMAQAQLLVDSVCKLLQLPQQKGEKYIEQQLESLSRKDPGLEIMVTALTHDSDNSTTEIFHTAKQTIVDWLLHKFQHKEKLWHLSPTLLARASQTHPSLCQQYLASLQQETQRVVENDVPKAIQCHTVLDTGRYRAVVDRFKCLLTEAGLASEKTQSLLTSMRESGQSFIWSEMEKQLQ